MRTLPAQNPRWIRSLIAAFGFHSGMLKNNENSIIKNKLIIWRRSEYEIAKRDLETEKLGARGSLHTPFRFDQLSDKDLNQYDALYIPGGHAPLMVRSFILTDLMENLLFLKDLTNNPELGRIILHFHNNSKPTGIICHGPVALMSTRFAGDGMFLVLSRRQKSNLLSW